MDKVTINWYQTNWSAIDCHQDTVLYSFTRAGNLLYIGIAYRQTIVDEVRQTLNRLNLSTIGMSIWLGYVDRSDTTYSRITEEIVRDTECLLIHMNAPTQNTQCSQSYTGRWGFRVVSRGLLNHRISCNSKGVLTYT